MTLKDHIQRWMKKHKRRTLLHTTIGFFGSVLLLVFLFIKLQQKELHAIPYKNNTEVDMTIGMVGDMMFGRNVAFVGLHKGYGFLFSSVNPFLKRADFLTGNFENPIVNKEAGNYVKADKYIHLHSEPCVARVLKQVGFDLVNIANNHIKDYGDKGLDNTMEQFKKVKINTVGAGKNLKEASGICYKKVKGIRIAFLGTSDVLPKSFGARKDVSGVFPFNPSYVLPLVSEAKEKADIVLVHIHWGQEYDHHFHPRQRDIGHALVDAGADVVIGHHPHVLEPVELYNKGVIFYSLGNFIFDQGWSRTKETVIAYYSILKNGTRRIELQPLYIEGARPCPLSDGIGDLYRREKILSQLTQERMYSHNWNKVWNRRGSGIYRGVKKVEDIA